MSDRATLWATREGPKLRQRLGVQLDPREPGTDSWRQRGASLAPEREEGGVGAWNLARLDNLHASCRERMRGFVVAANEIAYQRGAVVCVWDGLRSLERQVVLLARGASRTISSRHLVGLGIDLILYVPGEGPSWKLPPWYPEHIGPLGLRAGLFWGRNFPGFTDTVHFELPRTEWPEDLRSVLAEVKDSYRVVN